MYQPDFPPVPFRLGLYPVVDSVAWIERLLEAGVRTLQLRIKDRRDSEVEDEHPLIGSTKKFERKRGLLIKDC